MGEESSSSESSQEVPIQIIEEHESEYLTSEVDEEDDEKGV